MLYLCVTVFCVVGVARAYFNDFITLHRTQTGNSDSNNTSNNWDFGDIRTLDTPTTDNYVRSRQEYDWEPLYYDVGARYRLRFKPLQPMPRLFWHKLPKPQSEPEPQPQPTPQTTTATAEPTDESITEVVPTTEPAVEMPTTTTTESTTTTSSSSTRRPSRPSTMHPFRPSSTMTSIMRPPVRKQLFFFGSPLKLNLWQQKQQVPRNATKTKSHGKGFLSLFEVIKFANAKCNVDMGDIRSMEGVCYHEFECKSLGGIPTQPCADGVGVCCIFLTGCGDTTKQPVVYFESPNYPKPVFESMICVLIINLREHVEQLRLDFLLFELSRPTDGDCLDDQFIVSGQNINFVVPVLCGINTGQHLYIHVGNSAERKIYISFFAKSSGNARSFNIKVMQLESELAPDGCLQYYTETEAVVKSFNYDTDGSIVDNREATYLNNLNYAICMARAKDTCTVTYYTEQTGGYPLDFQIINKDEAENDLVPDGQAGAGIFNCPDDYIAINQVRLCGERFNDGIDSEDFTQHATVKDVAAGPIILPVRSDEEYVGRGFRLIYKQELCV